MSNEQLKSAINRVRQAHSRLSVGINNAIKSGTQDPSLRTVQTSVGSFSDIGASGKTSSGVGGALGRKDSRKDRPRSSRVDSPSGQRGQMVSLNKPLGKPFLSAAHAGASSRVPGARLFKEDHHELDPPVATASSINSMPSFRPHEETAITTKYGPGVRYSGTEYLTAFNTSLITAAQPSRGELLYAMPISPHSIPDTRLGLASQMFTRYIFKSLKFYYMPTAPATTPGSLLMFCDYDPSQNPTVTGVGDGVLRYSFAHKASESSVWQKQACEVTDHVYNDLLYCDPDEELRWSVQGCFWLISTGALPVGTEMGKIVMEYEIDFAVPDYRGSIQVTPVVTTQASHAGSAGQGLPFVFTLTAPPTPGAYFARLENTLTGNIIPLHASRNAYQQGAPAISMVKGAGAFVVVRNASTNCTFQVTPDFYGSIDVDTLSMVNSTATVATTFNLTLYPIERVTND